MAIKNLDEDMFVALLNSHLHPSSPITSNEYLYGRGQQLEHIRRALASPGGKFSFMATEELARLP